MTAFEDILEYVSNETGEAAMHVMGVGDLCFAWFKDHGIHQPTAADVVALTRLVLEREARYREQELTAENHAAWRKMDDELAALSTRASRVSGSAQ